MNTLADSVFEYQPTTWVDVAFITVIGLTIVTVTWIRNRRKS